MQNYLGVPVHVGHVSIEWLNHLKLEDLYLEDEAGEVLFRADHVSAGFEVMPLLKKRFVFTTVRLFGFDAHLKKADPEAPLNLQFLLDAFASKDTVKKETNVDLRFNTILIRRGNFRYDVESAPQTPGKFNAKHVDIRDLSARRSEERRVGKECLRRCESRRSPDH